MKYLQPMYGAVRDWLSLFIFDKAYLVCISDCVLYLTVFDRSIPFLLSASHYPYLGQPSALYQRVYSAYSLNEMGVEV